MRLSLQRAVLLAAATLSAGCATPEAARVEPAGEGTVLARLVAGESALAGAKITAVMNPGVEFREEVHNASVGEDATAVLSLPPGSWYLSALSADGSWVCPMYLDCGSGNSWPRNSWTRISLSIYYATLDLVDRGPSTSWTRSS